MKSKTLVLAIAFFSFSQNYLFAQEKLNIKYGKIAPSDFDLSQSKLITALARLLLRISADPTSTGTTKAGFHYRLKNIPA
jgi:hypothetical protein